jgi:hypothetical protein
MLLFAQDLTRAESSTAPHNASRRRAPAAVSLEGVVGDAYGVN